MATAEHKVDRTGWPAGPWDGEPDRVQWTDEATGLPCLIVRGPVGALCGYVGVTQGHPAFESPYDDVAVDVHGGLTYADKCYGHICHVPEPGQPDDVYWLGFDCSHYYDVSPGMLARGFTPPAREGVYRNIAYVRAECASLARQLAALPIASVSGGEA